MRKALGIRTERIIKEHEFRRRWGKTVIALSLAVALGMSYALILPAITMEESTYCGYEQHTEHIESCYTESRTLVCGLSEEGHTHSGKCYEEQTVLSCGIDENSGHIHTEACRGENGEYSCGLDEGAGAHHHKES